MLASIVSDHTPAILQIVKMLLTRMIAPALASDASQQGTAWTPRLVATVATTALTGPMSRDAPHQVQMKMTATSGIAIIVH